MSDISCDSGFRFGEGSGAETGLCVSRTDNQPDAGLIDEHPPTAHIASIETDCDVTEAIFDGSASDAFQGRTLETFAWTILGPNGELIDTFSGSPGAPILRSSHRLGGQFIAPKLNVTPYHGRMALLVESEDNVVLRSRFEGTGDSLLPMNIAISFAMAVEGAPTTATVSIAGAFSTTLVETISVTPTLQAHSVTYQASAAFNDTFKLEFGFGSPMSFWVDHVSAFELDNHVNVIANGSVEDDGDKWFIDASGAASPAEVKSLPRSLLQDGVYRVSLQVTDSEGTQSAPFQMPMTIEGCLGGGL